MTVRLESVTFTSGDGETRVQSYLATPDRDGRHPDDVRGLGKASRQGGEEKAKDIPLARGKDGGGHQ